MLHCVVTRSSLTPKKSQNRETTSKYQGESNEKCASEECQNREEEIKIMLMVTFCCCCASF